VFIYFYPKVGVEESIVNAPLISFHSKNKAKSEVRFKQLIRESNPWCVHSRLSMPTLRIQLTEHPIVFLLEGERHRNKYYSENDKL
jgi:hypothetical protein